MAKPNVDPGTFSELTKSEFTLVKLLLHSSKKKNKKKETNISFSLLKNAVVDLLP